MWKKEWRLPPINSCRMLLNIVFVGAGRNHASLQCLVTRGAVAASRLRGGIRLVFVTHPPDFAQMLSGKMQCILGVKKWIFSAFALHIGQRVRRGVYRYALYLSGIGKIRKQFPEWIPHPKHKQCANFPYGYSLFERAGFGWNGVLFADYHRYIVYS